MHHFQLIRCLGRGSGGEAGIMLRMFCACRVGSCFFKIHLQIGRIFTSHFGDHSWFCSFHRGWLIWSLRNAAGHACGRLWWAEVRAEIRATGRWVMQVDALWTLGLLGCHFCQDQWKIQYTQCISYFFNISNLHCLHISHILWVFTGNDPVIFHWYLGFAVHHFRGLIQEQCHQALQEVAILWLCLTWILFFDWVKEMWCFERVKICKNQFIDFVVPTSMRGTWLAKTNNFRCFWGSSEKNWKQRLHFESFVPQFSSESSHFPGVPCHILMCCASRQRFYITSLWSYPLSSVTRVTCRRESLLILLTICWLIPLFININRQQLCE